MLSLGDKVSQQLCVTKTKTQVGYSNSIQSGEMSSLFSYDKTLKSL